MFADCCQAQITHSNQYRRNSSHTEQSSQQPIKKNRFNNTKQEIYQEENEWTDTPLKVKLINALGLRQFVIDKLVFARPQSSYRLQVNQNPKIFQFSNTKFRQIPGYQIFCDIIDLPNHYIPVIYFRKLSTSQSSSSQLNEINQLKLMKSKLTMIYSHGNSSNLQLSFQIIEMMIKKYPIDYIIYDYTGYGKGSGQVERFIQKEHKLSDSSICADILQVIKWSQAPAQQIILWGYSLGCHPSIYAATKLKLNSIIIQSPFSSIYNMVESLPTQLQQSSSKPYKDDIFNNLSLISYIMCDCLLIHSQDDDLIPISHSKTLMKKFKQNGNNLNDMRLIQICNIKHNQMPIVFCVKKTNPLQEELMKYLLERGKRLVKREGNKLLRGMNKKHVKLNNQDLSLLEEKKQICINDMQISELSNSIQSSAKNNILPQLKSQPHKYFPSVSKKSLTHHPKNNKFTTNSTHETEVSDEILLFERQKHQNKFRLENQVVLEGNSLRKKKLPYSFSIN